VQITLSPVFLDRFRLALDDLGVANHDRIMLAVSGGPDSLAMLLLAREVAADHIVAATVDHKLRPEAADEAAFVGDLCSKMGVRHVALSPPQKISGNIQSTARMARYALLETAADEHQCAWIATAHHGDDQLETILMRLARGSGLDGLSAIRPRNGRIIRPLLGFSKSELEKICADAEIEPVRDPSNDNADFDRVAMRQWLAQSPHPFDIDRANRTARVLGEAAEAMAWVIDGLSEQRIFQENMQIQCDATHLPRDLKRRLLMRSLSRLEPDLNSRGHAIDRLLADLESGKNGMIGNILCRGGAVWQFSIAPPRRADL
jgi:tRNA(Ile)-lysidine synthase